MEKEQETLRKDKQIGFRVEWQQSAKHTRAKCIFKIFRWIQINSAKNWRRQSVRVCESVAMIDWIRCKHMRSRSIITKWIGFKSPQPRNITHFQQQQKYTTKNAATLCCYRL